MTKTNSFLSLLAMAAAATFAGAAPAPSAPPANSPYDFYICAALNKGYVTGSKITTVSGLFKRDAAGAWQHIGYNDLSITAAAFDPRDHAVIYTAALNGCWRSLDGGKTWRQTNGWDITEGRDVAVDPHAPDHVYLALPDGVAVSSDRAQTWVRKENGLPERGKYTQVIKVDRDRAGRVLAGCESGIYLTENGAKSWRRVLPTTTTVDDIEQAPNDPKQWVAVTQSAGAWASIDGGVTWKRFPGVPADHALYNIAFDPTHPRRLAIGSWSYGVLTTEDSGATWTDRNAGLPTPHRVARVGVDPDTGRLYASVINESLYTSDDFGRTWQRGVLEGSVINNFIILPKAAK
jgi:photosystem II stability/assembly factor-like uncharacterized protein